MITTTVSSSTLPPPTTVATTDNCVRVNNNDLNNVNIVVVDDNGFVVDDNGFAADAGWQLYEGRQHLDGEHRREFHHRLELGSIRQPNG